MGAKWRYRVVGWRWEVASVLNRLRRVCWCDLVDWMYRDKPAGERPRLIRNTPDYDGVLRHDSTKSCRTEAIDLGLCYCGKFRTAEIDAATDLAPGFIVSKDDT